MGVAACRQRPAQLPPSCHAIVEPLPEELPMTRLLPLCLVLFALTAASGAQAQQVDRIEIVEWGLFAGDRVGEVVSPHSVTGTTNLVNSVRLQQATTTVPALVGMTFGLRFKVAGSPPGARGNLKCVTRLPSQGVTNPAKGKTFCTSEFQSDAVIGGITYRGYTLDYDWEVETGPWTLEIWHDGRKLAEKTFIVTRLVSAAE